MSFKLSKCESCKFFLNLESAPWIDCEKYPDNIPEKVYQNTMDSNEPINCAYYEYNPEWDKD